MPLKRRTSIGVLQKSLHRATAVKYEASEIYDEFLIAEQTTDSLANSLRHSGVTAMQIRTDQLFNKRQLNIRFCLHALLM